MFLMSVKTGGRLRYRMFKKTVGPDIKAANCKKSGVSGAALCTV
jgi:hypothetical protein